MTGITHIQQIKAVNLELACPTSGDVDAAREIMMKYADAEFDLVDCIIMAMAERLDIKQVCTFDHRDFSIFRPAHTQYLQLFP